MTRIDTISPRKEKGGYTMTEMVIYIAVLTLLVVVVSSMLVAMSRSYSRAVVSKKINSSAFNVIERLTREARRASLVTNVQTSPASITLNTSDVSGNSTTVQIYSENGIIKVRSGGVEEGPLTADGVTASNLSFVSVSTSSVRAVRAAITLTSTAYGFTDTATFYTGALLRSK